MTDDIVTRLRIIHCFADDLTPCGTCLPCEAADEIERLRYSVQRLSVAMDDISHLTDDRNVLHRIKEARHAQP